MGGLGLNTAKSKNRVLLCGLTWRLLANPSSRWAKVLIHKYGSNKSNNTSFIWKNILKGWLTCRQEILWLPCKNSKLNIWDTCWIPLLTPLRNCMEGPLQKKDQNLAIKDIVENGKWKFNKISFNIPLAIMDNVNSIPQPLQSLYKPLWSLNSNGIFNSKSCSHLINNWQN